VSEREHPDRLYLFSVAPTPGADTTYFLRYRNVGLLSLPLEVWRADALRAERSRESLLLGIYYGCLLALIVYNLMLYIATRLRAYLAYVGYGAVMLFFMATQNGYTSFYLWPEWPALADPAAYVSPLAALGGACVFVREYLATATLTPAIDRALRALTAATFVLLAVNPLLPRPAAFWSMLFWGGTGAALVYALALYFALALRSRPGTFLSIALTLPVLGAALAVARNVGWLAVGWVTEHGMQIGMMVEMLVLSLGLAEQVAVIHREREEARRAAAEDTLTGLASRARLAAQLPAALSRARRGTHKLALLWLDLDNFKPINDRYGHAVGDAVLKEAAARMRETVRTHDFVARLGGDEFVILADVYDGTAEASALAARLINAIERPMRQGHLDLSVTASIGIAVFPQHAESESDLMQRADLAMYQAKAEGRNTFKLAA
jgi:diguanylate cyclase (GGDEF)-like protein